MPTKLKKLLIALSLGSVPFIAYYGMARLLSVGFITMEEVKLGYQVFGYIVTSYLAYYLFLEN